LRGDRENDAYPERERESKTIYDSSIRSLERVYDSESSRGRIASLNGLYVSRANEDEVVRSRCRVRMTTESRGEMLRATQCMGLGCGG
jgi:hypothetical protein